MFRDNLRAIFYIVLKDMRTYYLKPPAISWGIAFPVVWILAFYLRNPKSFEELLPGLVAMTILFSTTAAEAVVINFEMRLGSLERLLLAPVSLPAVLLGKILGGALFGLLMTIVVATGSAIILGAHPQVLYLILIVFPSLFAFAALGALLCVSVKEVFEAQTLLNLPRFVMIFLCGVVFPVSAMPKALQFIAYLVPLTYTVEGLRRAFTGGPFLPVLVDFLLLVGFSLIFIYPAFGLLKKKFE